MTQISCTTDELAEALAATCGAGRNVIAIGNPNDIASKVATFLAADRIPEPGLEDDDDWIFQ